MSWNELFKHYIITLSIDPSKNTANVTDQFKNSFLFIFFLWILFPLLYIIYVWIYSIFSISFFMSNTKFHGSQTHTNTHIRHGTLCYSRSNPIPSLNFKIKRKKQIQFLILTSNFICQIVISSYYTHQYMYIWKNENNLVEPGSLKHDCPQHTRLSS